MKKIIVKSIQGVKNMTIFFLFEALTLDKRQIYLKKNIIRCLKLKNACLCNVVYDLWFETSIRTIYLRLDFLFFTFMFNLYK